MAVVWNSALSSRRRFLLSSPIANDAEKSFSVSKLIVRTLIESKVFSNTSLSESEWWYRYVEGEISLVTSVWRSLFDRVQKLVAYWSGATSRGCLAKSARVADLRSARLVVSAIEQGLKHVNTYCVDSCFWDIKLLDCHTQNVLRFLVAFLGQFVNIDWVGVLTQNSAKE